MLNNLLNIGTSLLGLGSARSQQRKSNAFAEKTLAQAQNQFDQTMDHSIYRRIEDAKRAGVHPLFALGASAGGSPTITAGSGGKTGGAVSDAVRGVGEALARATIGRENADAKKSEAEAALADSKTATITQRLATQGRDGVGITAYPDGGKVVGYDTPENDFTDGPVYGPAEFYNPPVPTSSAVGIAAGKRPGFIEIQMPDGRTVQNYDPELGLDEIGQLNYAIQRARHYATDSMVWASKNLSDQAILGYLKKKLLKKAPKGNTTPPGYRHRTRSRQ